MQSLHGNGHVDPKYCTVGISLASIPPIVHVHYHVREGRDIYTYLVLALVATRPWCILAPKFEPWHAQHKKKW